MDKTARFIVRYRYFLLIFVFIATIFFYRQYKKIEIEFGADKMLAADDPQRVSFERFIDHFDISEFFVITFHSDKLFSEQILSNIEFISRSMENIQIDKTGKTFEKIHGLDKKVRFNSLILKYIPEFLGDLKSGLYQKTKQQKEKLDSIYPPTDKRLSPVIETMNILSATEVRIAGDTIDIGPISIGGKAPTNETEIASLKNRLLSNPNYWNSIISRDGKTTAIVVSIKTYLAEKLIRDGMSYEKKKEIRKFIENYRREIAFCAERVIRQQLTLDKAAGLDIKYHLAGGPVFVSQYVDYVERDSALFLPLTLLVIALMLVAIYRNFWGVVLPLGIVIISIIWTFGMIQIVGAKMTLVSTILFPLILVIGMAVVIHIINQYKEEVSLILQNKDNALFRYIMEGKPNHLTADYKKEKKIAIQNTVKHIFSPCFWTSATTAVGFGSLGVSKVVPVSQTGLFAAWGVMATFFVAIILTPILLGLAPLSRKSVIKPFERGKLSGAMKGAAGFNNRYKKSILLASIILAILSFCGISKIVAETNLREYFKEDTPIRIAHKFMEDNLSGITTVEFAIETKEKGALKNPDVMKKIVSFQKDLVKKGYISKTYAITDTVCMMNQAMHEGNIEYYRIPDTRNEIAQYLLLYEQGGSLDLIVDTTYSFTYVTARFHNMGSRHIREAVNDIMEQAKGSFSELDVEIKPSGITWLGVLLEKYVVEGQIKSFALAMIIISIFMFFFLRSFGLGLAAIAPNVFPILLTMGFMGLAKIPINLATCMVPSIAIGIAVDDTIHFLNRYRRERKTEKTEGRAVERVMTTTGQAMVLTSVVLFFGFIVLLLSNFNPNIYFGALTALTMATALLGDLVLLPAILIFFKIKATR